MSATEPSPASPTLDTALAEVARTLDADGFVASWEQTEDGVSFAIGIGDTDCADCLVPRPVMELMLANALADTGLRLASLRMPTDPA